VRSNSHASGNFLIDVEPRTGRGRGLACRRFVPERETRLGLRAVRGVPQHAGSIRVPRRLRRPGTRRSGEGVPEPFVERGIVPTSWPPMPVTYRGDSEPYRAVPPGQPGKAVSAGGWGAVHPGVKLASRAIPRIEQDRRCGGLASKAMDSRDCSLQPRGLAGRGHGPPSCDHERGELRKSSVGAAVGRQMFRSPAPTAIGERQLAIRGHLGDTRCGSRPVTGPTTSPRPDPVQEDDDPGGTRTTPSSRSLSNASSAAGLTVSGFLGRTR